MSDLAALIAARYGTSSGATGATGATGAAATPALSPTAAPVLSTLLSHRSIRHYAADKPLPPGTLDLLLAAAQSAPSSCNLQTWSVVAVEDADRKAQLATLSHDQDFIRQAPLFLVFVADLHRMGAVAATQNQPPGVALEYTDMFLTASLDAGFAAQNAVVAAEALGLGTCYVGASRNNPREVAALLGLPDRAIAILGLAVGYAHADCTADVKPRLPAAELLHRERWNDSHQKQHLQAYDEAMGAFNASQKRTHVASWSAQSQDRVATVEAMQGRHELRKIIHERGFELQ